MAIDGTNILESDLGIDVQNEILDRYYKGQGCAWTDMIADSRQMKLNRI